VITIDLRGAEAFISKSKKARGQFTRTVFRSLKKSLRKPATERRRSTRGVPMLREIMKTPWGKRDRNKVTARVKVIGPWVKENTIQAGIGIYGYAAAARTGDRIIPHAIPSRRGTIQHPGARVIPQISGARTFREAPEILRQLERDVGSMLERVYGL